MERTQNPDVGGAPNKEMSTPRTLWNAGQRAAPFLAARGATASASRRTRSSAQGGRSRSFLQAGTAAAHRAESCCKHVLPEPQSGYLAACIHCGMHPLSGCLRHAYTVSCVRCVCRPGAALDAFLLKIVVEERLGYPVQLLSDGQLADIGPGLRISDVNAGIYSALARGEVDMYPEVTPGYHALLPLRCATHSPNSELDPTHRCGRP